MAKNKRNLAVKSEKGKSEKDKSEKGTLEEPGLAPAPREREVAHPLSGLRNEIDRLFEDFFEMTPFRRGLFDWDPFRRIERVTGATVPSVDISEDEKAFRIAAEMPGIDEDDIEVTLSEGVLRLKGHKKEEKEERDENHYVSERRYGSFERSFRLPESVDADKVEADLKKGVLTLTLPKTEEARKAARKIKVKTK